MKEGGFSKSLPMLKFLKDVYFFLNIWLMPFIERITTFKNRL